MNLQDIRDSLPPETIYTLDCVELAQGKAPARIWVASVGTFYHPSQGKFSLTPDRMSRMVENFNKQVERGRIKPVPIDIEHGSVREVSAEDKRAIGWVSSLSFDGDSLWADVEWTEEGERLVGSGGFRYTSPVVFFNWEDSATGERVGAYLHSIAATNQPVLPDGLPMVASRRAAESAANKTEIHGDGATVCIVRLANEGDGAGGGLPVETPTDAPEPDEEHMEMKSIDLGGATVEVPTDAADCIVAAFEALTARVAVAEKEPDGIVLSHDEHAALTEKAAAHDAATAALAEEQRAHRVERAIACGRLTPAMAANPLIAAAAHSESDWAHVLSLHPEKSAWDGEVVGESGGAGVVELTPEQELEALVEKHTASGMARHDALFQAAKEMRRTAARS